MQNEPLMWHLAYIAGTAILAVNVGLWALTLEKGSPSKVGLAFASFGIALLGLRAMGQLIGPPETFQSFPDIVHLFMALVAMVAGLLVGMYLFQAICWAVGCRSPL